MFEYGFWFGWSSTRVRLRVQAGRTRVVFRHLSGADAALGYKRGPISDTNTLQPVDHVSSRGSCKCILFLLLYFTVILHPRPFPQKRMNP